jgi:hypothetical protein
MSSETNNSSSERPGENAAPDVAASLLIRSKALLATTRTESTGHISPIVDKLNYDEAKGDTVETLPDDMAEDDQAASEGAPPSQSPLALLEDEDYREAAKIAQEFYEVDVTAAGPDSSAMEDKRIDEIDSQKGDAEDGVVLNAEADGSAKDESYDYEDLTPSGSVKLRRKREGEVEPTAEN